MKPTFTLILLFFQVFVFAQGNSLPLVTVTGSGTVYAQPDEVLVTITLQSRDQQIEAVRAKSKTLAQNVISYLEEQGIAAEHIQTQYANLGPIYRNYESNEIIRYEAIQMINICIKDLDRYDAIIDGLLKQNIHRVGKPNFRTTDYERYQDEARVLALQAAKAKAQMMATTLEQSIGPAHSIVEETFHNSFAPISYEAVNPSTPPQNQGKSFAPGQLEIQAKVKVSFRLF